jgi:hypothetical protein
MSTKPKSITTLQRELEQAIRAQYVAGMRHSAAEGAEREAGAAYNDARVAREKIQFALLSAITEKAKTGGSR